MTNEFEVMTMLEPVKKELVKEHGAFADWGFQVDEDDDGIRMIRIRLTVDEDASFSAEEIEAIKMRIRSSLRENPRTGDYFPLVQFYARSITSVK